MQNEHERLAALHEYDILDSTDVAAFGDVVTVAAAVCGASVALVSFVDLRRQWFAAELGLGLRETARENSVCAHALWGPGTLVIPDLREDPRSKANPVVTQPPHLRFYAGAVMKTPAGLPLGTVCVLDDKPRPEGLTPAQLNALQALARQVMAQLELRRALQQHGAPANGAATLLAETKAMLAERNAALAERDRLAQEAHHRVQASLAAVQSLLRPGAAPLDARAHLQDAAHGVRSLVALHALLHHQGAATDVDLAAYLRSALDGQRALSPGRTILFDALPDGPRWPAADAPTLGLILLELVTNALRYGAGTITVTLDHDGAGVILSVEDEGQGLPAQFCPEESRGFGMRLVTGLLANQQRGHLSIDRTRGHTCFVVTLKAAASPV